MNWPSGMSLGVSSADRPSASGTQGDISNQHPDFAYRLPDWRQMRDTWQGQRAVKERTTCYLPMTSGMLEDNKNGSCKGTEAYNAYLLRALFHSFVSDAVDNMLGMLWNKPAVYELPSQLDYLRNKASTQGETIAELHRAINRQQLIVGRLGLLADLPGSTNNNPEPYIALYDAEKIINWDAGFRGDTAVETTNLVVLDESGPVRVNIFGWDTRSQYRVLMLGDPEGNEERGVYRYGVFKQEGNSGTIVPFDFSKMATATSRGMPFDQIPWTFINANSTLSASCDPPLLGLSDLSLAIYRLEADYRQALFQQTQDTLFTKGFTDNGDKPLRTGAGGRIHGNTDKADAKYIGVTSTGLPELRTARESDLKLANSKAGELMDASSRARESGTALEMRIGSKTATMTEIAIAAGEGLQKALRHVGQWAGVSDLSQIVVKPNFEFASREFEALDMKALVESKMLGAPFSWEALHNWSAKRGGPGAELKFTDMMKMIENEMTLGIGEQLQPPLTEKDEAEIDMQKEGLDIQRTAAKNKPKPTSGSKK